MASLKTFNTAEMQPCFCNFRKQIFEFLMCLYYTYKFRIKTEKAWIDEELVLDTKTYLLFNECLYIQTKTNKLES